MLSFIFKKLKGDASGTAVIEYGLIIALVMLTILGTLQALGIKTVSMFDSADTALATAGQVDASAGDSTAPPPSDTAPADENVDDQDTSQDPAQ